MYIFKTTYSAIRNENNWLNERGEGNCMMELETLMFFIFTFRILLNLYEIGRPILTRWLKHTDKKETEHVQYTTQDELALEPYENNFEDYTEMVLQVNNKYIY